MTIMTERLPIAHIPEQLLIAPMRNNVIDFCRRDNLACRIKALHADWMCAKKSL